MPSPSSPPFAARPLEPIDHDEAVALAVESGVHGVYVGNYLRGDAAGDERGDLLGLYGTDGLLGLGYFGSRGNLVLLQRAALDPGAVATALRHSGMTFRIVLGPEPWVGALASAEPRPPIVHRRQLYYGVAPANVVCPQPPPLVRAAERKDQARLLDAALDLNLVDLCVEPERVHRPWLRDAIKRRVRARQTWVVGELGQPLSKLDIGSAGVFGMVLEGVYTFPRARSKGLATGLVAAVAAAARVPLVCLHVAESNAAARHAYERAGMSSMGTLGLMLRG